MRHVKLMELASAEVATFATEGAVSVDFLSRELALAAATGDERVQLLSAMQMLGNIRDFLVAQQSPEAERFVDQAIKELMRRERQLPAEWRNS